MQRLLALCFAVLFSACPVRAGTPDTINPVPGPGASFQNRLQDFLKNEDADRFNEMFDGFVVGGGVGTTQPSLTHTPSALVAYPAGYRITETGAITYSNNADCWVIANKDTTGNLTSDVTWTRVSNTHYLINCSSSTKPDLPTGAIWLMQVTTNGGSITAVADIRNLSPIKGREVINVLDWGCAGDNSHDDYACLQRVAAHINTDICPTGGGAIVWFPGENRSGTAAIYKIDQYRIDGGGSANGITDIAWGPGCDGLSFVGYGARIEIKGDFNRATDNGASSYSNAVCPFWIKSNRNVSFEGFVLDGNNDQTTENSSTVIEGNSHCFRTGNYADGVSATAITNVTVKNSVFLNCSVDGIYIGNSNPIDRNVLIENVWVEGASRNNISVVQARGVTIKNSQIRGSGLATANYAPRAGLDIEPIGCKTGSGLCSIGVATLDDNTGDVLIENVEFYNPGASHFIAQLPYVEHVVIDRSTFLDMPNSTQEIGGLVCNDCTVRNSYFYCSTPGITDCHFIVSAVANTTNAKILVENNTFDVNGRGIWVVTRKGDVTIRGNTFRYIGAGPLAFGFPTIQVPTDGVTRFFDNVIYIPASVHDGTTSHEATKMEPSGGQLYAGNNWYTTDPDFNDVCTASVTPWSCCTGADTGTCDTDLYFYVDYIGSGFSSIKGDHFSPLASNPNFRPLSSSTFLQVGQPYSQGFDTLGLTNFYATLQTVASDGTGAHATATITPDAVDNSNGSYYQITCNDSDGCDLTLSETDIPRGTLLMLTNESANIVYLNDSAGVQETTSGGAVSLSQHEGVIFQYKNDRWYQLAGDQFISVSGTVDFDNIVSTPGCNDKTVTVSGAASGDLVLVGVPDGSVVAAGQVTGWVSAADTVTLRLCVFSGSNVNAASGTFKVAVRKQ